MLLVNVSTRGKQINAQLRLAQSIPSKGTQAIPIAVAKINDRHLPATAHTVGKIHTQQIERKHLTLRTRIKRLARKTICFSKSVFMHDTVIGLFVNRYEFGTPV